MIVLPRNVGTFLMSRLLISLMFSAVEINNSMSSFDRSRRAIMCLCLNSAISVNPPIFFEYHFNRLFRTVKNNLDIFFLAGRDISSDKIGPDRQFTVTAINQNRQLNG